MQQRKASKKVILLISILLFIITACTILLFAVDSKTPYTVMVYMSGTDLESDYAVATEDIKEMLKAQIDDTKLNVIIQTGGTKEWYTKGILSDKSMIIKVKDDGIYTLLETPLKNMGDPKTLTEFINYGITEFPAEQYVLIFWDHGGGAVEVVCLDDWYGDDRLTLDEIRDTLEETALSKRKLALVGFDTCLMATVENAWLFSDYADYMAASEELEPGGGWDYTYLNEIIKNPSITGEELGRKIAGYYYAAYEDTDSVTMSVIDLFKMNVVSTALEGFSAALKEMIIQGNTEDVAKIRSALYEFGAFNSYSEASNMVDLLYFAEGCQELLPVESEALQQALQIAVIQNNSNIENTGGLSLFFPYRVKSKAYMWLEKYEKIGIFPEYAKFLEEFQQGILQKEKLNLTDTISQSSNSAFDIKIEPAILKQIEKIYLIQWQQSDINPEVYWRIGSREDTVIGHDGTIESVFTGQWFMWQGNLIPLEAFDGGMEFLTYSFPALLNGDKVQIIVEIDENTLSGTIKGSIPEKEYDMPIRIVKPVKEGDMIQIMYEINLFTEQESDFNEEYNGYQDGSYYYDTVFTVKELVFSMTDVEAGDYIYGYCFVDYAQNYYLTDFIGITFQ